MPKYIVPGVPAGAQPSAFMPHWNKYAASGAQQYKATVTGQPGTAGIPAPTRDTVPQPDLGDIAQMGTARSVNAPDVWYPQQYYQRDLYSAPGPVVPVRIWSDNLLPVPARDPTRRGDRGGNALLARPPLIPRRGNAGGATQLGQPRVVPFWGAGG